MRQTNSLCIHKRILSVILALAVLLLALPAWSMTANSAETTFAGEGTETNPYLISTAEQLKELAGNSDLWGSSFKLIADIDLNGSSSNKWTPIGTNTAQIAAFSGTFDGDGHMISGLYVNSSSSFQGLFGTVFSGGTIKNLGVAGTVIPGNADGAVYMGGIAGYNEGTVENCYSYVTIDASRYSNGNGYSGGIAGTNVGTVKNCYNIGTVSGTNYVGGIAGYNNINYSTVTNCYNTGDVLGSQYVGGIVGYNNMSTNEIQYCYNTGTVGSSSSDYAGGLVGYNKSGTVDKCYNIGAVSGKTFGAFAGYNSATITNCSRDKEVKDVGLTMGGANENGNIGTTAANLKTESSTMAILNNGSWTFSGLLSRPILTANPEIPGDGSDGDPYRLSTAEHLKALAAKVNGGNSFSGTYFKLTRGIDLSSVCGENIDGSEVSWTPIGNNGSYPYKPFSGTFDGGGHLISGLYINTDENSSQGLFGHIDGGTVKNLGISGSVTSKSTSYPRYAGGIGGIVGYSYNSNVQNCYNDSNVSGYYYVGGIAGRTEGSTTVQNCYNTGDIIEESGYESSAYAGGIVGCNWSSKVQNCYNTGDISRRADGNVGGIVGDEMSGSISNCYYLEGTAERGSGSWNDSFGYVEVKTEAQFKSGEAAWLLQHGKNNQNEQVWYQKVGTEDYPVFKPYDDTSVVYRVAFISEVKWGSQKVFGAFYGNSGFTVSAAPSGKPERDGYEFVRWTTDKAQTSKEYEFKSVTLDNKDVEIYAVWREKFGANDSANPLTIKISQGETSEAYDLDGLLAYYTDAAKAVGNFTYTSKYTGKDLTATVNGSKLTVTAADDAAVGEHVLTITAKEKSPQLSTIALADFGTSDVTLTVTVIVIGNREALDEDDIEVTKSGTTITVTSPDNTDGEFEYSKDGGKTWQSGNEFTGLTPGETYEISVRYKETDEYNASDSATKEVTTLNGDGSTTLKSGETVKNTKKGEDVTNKGGKVTVTDDNGNETTVTLPDGITDVEIDENGNVIIPGGSTVTPENGTEFTVDDEAIVGADGSVTLPDGGNIGFGKTDVNVPQNKPVTPNDDDTLTVPDGSAVTPPSGTPEIKIENADDKATVDKNGNVTFPKGGKAKVEDTAVDVPAGGTLKPAGNGYVQLPPDSKVTKDGKETELPDGGILDKDGNIVDNLVRIGDVIVILPEGGQAKENEDGSVTVPEGSTVIPGNGKPDYTIGENGGTVHDDGSVDIPSGGSIELGETTVTAPENGGTFTPNADETVTVPDGTTVTTPNGQDITITDADNKATVDKDGNITLPDGGDVKIGDTTVTVPEGGTIEPNEDGTVFLPEGSTVTKKDGTTVTVPKGGDIFDPVTGKLASEGSGNDPSGDTPTPPTGDNISKDNVNVGTVSGENAPKVTIDEDSLNKLKEEIIANHLTPEEKAAVENGATLDIILSIEVAEGSVPAEDKQTVEAFLADSEYAVGIHLNIELIKLINGQPTEKITKINTPINVTIEVPEEIRSANRVFAIVRVHDGEAEILEDTDNDPDTITIVTDKFSTYAIVYKDAEANPNTGMTTPIAVVALASAVIAAAVAVKKKKLI